MSSLPSSSNQAEIPSTEHPLVLELEHIDLSSNNALIANPPNTQKPTKDQKDKGEYPIFNCKSRLRLSKLGLSNKLVQG